MRLNIYDNKDRLVGQDYTRDNGEWMHKWARGDDRKFERGSWRGRAKNASKIPWKYKEAKEQ